MERHRTIASLYLDDSISYVFALRTYLISCKPLRGHYDVESPPTCQAQSTRSGLSPGKEIHGHQCRLINDLRCSHCLFHLCGNWQNTTFGSGRPAPCTRFLLPPAYDPRGKVTTSVCHYCKVVSFPLRMSRCRNAMSDLAASRAYRRPDQAL
jgi:hypothetical protein